MRIWALQAAMAAALATAVATPAAAGHFKKLSPRHTAYGVSQYNYANVSGGEFSVPLVTMNPNHVSQIGALLFYESNRGNNAGTEEVYAGCLVGELTPHASTGIDSVAMPFDTALYVEVIWAPRKKVEVNGAKTRLANGLGAVVETKQGHQAQLAHPSGFRLPKNSVVPGQKEDAIACVCTGLFDLGANLNTFNDFGVDCSLL